MSDFIAAFVFLPLQSQAELAAAGCQQEFNMNVLTDGPFQEMSKQSHNFHVQM